ncbi:unnamed protein product [Sphagnum balticum]
MDPHLSEQNHQGKPVPGMVVSEIETDSTTAISSASPTSKTQVQLAVDELEKGDDGNSPPDGEISPIRDPMAAKVFRGILEDSFLEYWWAEILAGLIMLLALMAIILILALHQGHTLPSWPFTITLNSLVSIMVVILKATMLAILASAVALDPFSQQVIQFYVTYTPSPKSNATLPRTTVYDTFGVHIGAALAPLDHPMEGAIMAGFYTPGSDAYTVEVSNCLTGNCSFPVQYRTIGMCHGCYEVTEFVTGHCSYSSPDANGSATTSLQDGCTYSLPSNTSISQSGYSDPQWLAGVSGPPSSIIPSAPEGNIWQWETIFTTKDINTTCANTACPNSTCTGAACGAAAMECYFQPCINTYNATVAKGTFNEYLIASEPIPYTYNSSSTYQSACWTNLRKDCLNPHDWEILNSQGINATTYANAEYIPYCNSDIGTLNNEGFSSECVYEFYEESYFPFLQFFKGFMVGNVSGQQQNGVTGPPDLNFLYNYGAITVDTVNATFASMASTMSARMRVAGNATYSAPAQGEILETLTLIRVAWAWLALPVALVALTLIFMVAVIIQTFINGRRPIGKTFSLGLLLTGVAGTVGDEFADLKYLHEAITDLSGVKDAHAPIVKAATEAKIQIKGEGSVKKLIKV